VDEALKSQPHIIDGKQVDPKRAVAKQVCCMAEYIYDTLPCSFAAVTDKIVDHCPCML